MSQPPFGQQSSHPSYGQPPSGYGQPAYGQPPFGQPAHGQPVYGQPAYGQPAGPGGPGPGGPAVQHGYGAPQRRASVGVVGTVIALLGAIAVAIAFLGPNWGDSDHTAFSDFHDAVTSAPSDAVSGLSHAYFGWLAWALLAVAFVLAVVANLPSPAAVAMRLLGALVALGRAAVTVFAIKLEAHGPGLSEYLKHARIGFWLAVAGFVVVAVGALIGPRRA